jgi:hypothetical protein
MLAEDGSGLTLDPTFEAAIQDLRNFGVKADLLHLYPELTPFFDTQLRPAIEHDVEDCIEVTV